jgi:uncharacterized delta-60 repeat protein
LSGITPATDAPLITATYVVDAPGGTWDAADNGVYTIAIAPAAARDAAGNAVTGITGTFNVSIVSSPPTTGTATVQIVAADVTTAGGPSEDIAVTYSSTQPIDLNTISVRDLSVTHGSKGLKITGVSVAPSADGTSAVATYTAAAPHGAWATADNGAYSVTVKAGEVADTSGNHNAVATGSFSVNVAAAVPLLATVSPPPDIVSEGGTTQTIIITYSGPAPIDVATIDTSDLAVTVNGAPGPPVTAVGTSSSTDGTSVTATYTITAPGGSWDLADAGAYAVALQSGQVTDTSGNSAPPVSVSFDVKIAPPPPAVDTSFSGGMPVTSGFVVEAAVAEPDGKIVVAGRDTDPVSGSSHAVHERFNPDGTVDASFGSTGTVKSPDTVNQSAFAVVVQDDGSIVSAGTVNGDFVVTRHKKDGSLDRRFGAGGETITDLGGSDVAYSLAIAADGSIVAAGSSGSSFAFVRYLSNGRLDSTFGVGGIALVPAAGGGVIGNLVIQDDGSIVGAGAAGGNVAVVRLTSAGALDPTFGAGGTVVLSQLTVRNDLGEPDHTEGLALQSDGKIVVSNRSGSDFGIARIDTAGALDPAFGSGGVATIDFGGDDDADVVLVQGSGDIIVAGTTNQGGAARTAVAALNPDGTLNPAFNQGGKFTLDVSLASRAIHIGDLFLRAFGALQPNGKLIVGSSGQGAGTQSATLTRINVPGSGTLGHFGLANGKNRRLVYIDADGGRVVIALKAGGIGRAFYNGSSIDLVVSGTTADSGISIKKRGGDGRVAIRNVQLDGGLKSFSAKTADLSGSFSTGGSVTKIALGSLSGMLAVPGGIANMVVAGDVTRSLILSGASLGADRRLGGVSSARDSYNSGTIGKLRVGGQMTGSIVAAGIDPHDGVLLNGNDSIIDGVASFIGSIVVRGGADPATRFVAGLFGKARLPQKVDPTVDSRFEILH